MGGIESKITQIDPNRISVNNKNLGNCTENFWKIDSCGTIKDAYSGLLPRNEKRPKYLKKTVTKIDGRYSLGLLWRYEF